MTCLFYFPFKHVTFEYLVLFHVYCTHLELTLLHNAMFFSCFEVTPPSVFAVCTSIVHFVFSA